MARTHTDREFEEELRELRERLLLMAGRVEEMIAHAIRALLERDADLARATIALDRLVNRAEREIDDRCLRLLARRQPLGSDLRFVALSLKMVTDLERIGDLAVNVCERAASLAQQAPVRVSDGIPRLATLVQGMVREAMDSFVAGDATRAEEVIHRDDEADELYHQIFREQIGEMRQAPASLEQWIQVQSVSKLLERMADHATNLAEEVIFMVRGEDIRHQGKLPA
ncbi:MAG: phosphate signaling complex protein PhoU [Deltaproteobacteria bacterium]|nr:phosphate signaling complex protein PhoU [Deltaproteobacteria bacterium]